MARNTKLAYGYTVTITPTIEQLEKIDELRGTDYIISQDIRNNYLDKILDKAIETHCVEEEHEE